MGSHEATFKIHEDLHVDLVAAALRGEGFEVFEDPKNNHILVRRESDEQTRGYFLSVLYRLLGKWDFEGQTEGKIPASVLLEDRVIEREPDEVSFDEIVAKLAERDIKAYVEQTGGGCATIYVGEPFEVSDKGSTWSEYPVLVGPGWFEGSGWTDGYGSTHELFVGPDGDGTDNDYVIFTDGVASVNDIVEAIVSKLRDHEKKVAREGVRS